MRLDARTLAPLRGGWSRAVQSVSGMSALSPLGSRVAISTGGRLLVIDTATGQVVRRHQTDPWGERLYWLGGEGKRRDPYLLVVKNSLSCWSLGCGHEFHSLLPVTGYLGDSGYLGDATTAVLRTGVVIEYRGAPKALDVYGTESENGNITEIILRRMSPTAPFRVVADVARHRLFAISSAGLVAEIDRPDRRPRITYHPVNLNGGLFEAAWAGAGKIALWGKDGLGTIDTRTWTTQAIAAPVAGVVATPFGFAVWSDDPGPTGLSVYRPDGRKRLHVLAGKRIDGGAQAVGEYLYVDTDLFKARYSINLRTGQVKDRCGETRRSSRPTSSPFPSTMAPRSPLSMAFHKMSRDAMLRLTCQVRSAFVALAVVAVALTPAAAARDWSTSGFGEGGWTSVFEGVNAIAPQANGKIVLVNGDGGYLMRLLADGRIDRSFGKQGVVENVLRRAPCDTGACLRTRVAVGGDGKIVIAQNSDHRSILSRWLGDGRLDRTFGVGGRVNIVGSAQVSTLAVAPKGAIVVALTPRDSRRRTLLARFLADGRVDNRFGNGGRTRIASRQPVAVLVQSGGKIVVAGKDISLARYRSHGSPDNSFGSNSIVRIEGFYVQSAALDPDRSIVLAGGGVPRETQVIRVLPDGQLDPRFGGDGVVGHAYNVGLSGAPNAVAVLPQGAVVIAGVTQQGSDRSSGWLSAVAQPDGSWEHLPGPPGSCLAEDNPDYPKDVYAVATAIAVAKDGKVLIAGHSDCDWVVGRFTPAPDNDPGPPLRLDT